ncbi:MAG: hypothetical protein NDI61_08270 [Bdellovibrionaceae bacterium]|nr:hypothetical protein [Pseudobdellovibrionaceae bacterium]
MPNEVHVKKVKAYPIPAQMVSGLGPAKAEIRKLTYIGFMAEIGESKIQAGDKLEITFVLPVVHLSVKEQCVVVKLYNHFAMKGSTLNTKSGSDTSVKVDVQTASVAPTATNRSGLNLGEVMHMAEIHFKPLSANGKKNIGQFLKMLSQPPSGV